MNREKTERKIKDLNAIRAMQKKYLKENEEKYNKKEISDEKYNKHKHKIESKIEKIKHQIRELEEEIGHLKHEEK